MDVPLIQESDNLFKAPPKQSPLLDGDNRLKTDLSPMKAILVELYLSVEKERHMHKLTGIYLLASDTWFVFLPSIALAFLAGIIALLVPASAWVGVIPLLSAFCQAWGKHLRLASRGDMHEQTSIVLRDLTTELHALITSSDTDISDHEIKCAQERFIQARNTCGSNIPVEINNPFDVLQKKVVLSNENAYGNTSINNFRIGTAYDILVSKIIQNRRWPFLLPRAEKLVEETFDEFERTFDPHVDANFSTNA